MGEIPPSPSACEDEAHGDDTLMLCDLPPGHEGDHLSIITWPQGETYISDHNPEDCGEGCVSCLTMRIWGPMVGEALRRGHLLSAAFNKRAD
jgi:hypothetical protein